MTTIFVQHVACRGHDMGPRDPDVAQRLDEVPDALIAAGRGGMINTTRHTAKPEIATPDDLAAALAAVPAAEAHFASFPPGARREYLEWVTSAKQPATRAKRIETTVVQAAEGKRMNWKYDKC